MAASAAAGRGEYPYCTMYGVNIVDGNIVSRQNIQRSLLFGPEGGGTPPSPCSTSIGRRSRSFAARSRPGLHRLHFNQSRSVSARKSEGGRRFKRLVKDRETGPDSATA